MLRLAVIFEQELDFLTRKISLHDRPGTHAWSSTSDTLERLVLFPEHSSELGHFSSPQLFLRIEKTVQHSSLCLSILQHIPF